MMWTGRVISALPILFMGFGGLYFLFFKFDVVNQGIQKYGFPAAAGRGILITEISVAFLYLIPQTAMLGAILTTGYLGGAVATHVRAGENFAPPIVFGILVWLGLLLRDRQLWALLPLRRWPATPTRPRPAATQSVDPIE